MKIVKPSEGRVRAHHSSDIMRNVKSIVEQPDGYDYIPNFGVDKVVTCDSAIILHNAHPFTVAVATFELGAFNRPVLRVDNTLLCRIVGTALPFLTPWPVFASDNSKHSCEESITVMKSTGLWGTPILKRRRNQRFASEVVHALWGSWFFEETQYDHINTTGLRGPVSRIPIPESVWGVYDVLPPPAGSSAALLLDHHNKFRTT